VAAASDMVPASDVVPTGQLMGYPWVMAFVRTDGPDGIELGLTPGYYRSRGAFMGALGLFLSAVCGSLPIGLEASGESVGDGAGLLVLTVVLGLVLGVVRAIFAGVIVANASSLASRSVVRFAGGALHAHDGRAIPLSAVARFELRRRPGRGFLPIRGWPRWLVVDEQGQTHLLTEGVHPLLDGKKAARQLRALAEELGKPFDDRSGVSDLGLRAPICYLPIGALFLPASLLVLAFGRDERVRFAAKQSLLHLALTVGLAVVLGGTSVATFAVCDRAGLSPALVIIPAGATFLTIFVLNVVLRFYAMCRAFTDPLWVMPWLGRIARRWRERVTKDAPLAF